MRFTPRSSWRRLRAHPIRALFMLLVFGFVALNVLAFLHAYSMTHFTERNSALLVRRSKEDAGLERLSLAGKVHVLIAGVQISKPCDRATPGDFALPFETHQFRSSGGIQCEAWHIPAATPKGCCILVHGYAGTKADLLDEARAFHQLGYAVFLVDLRGSGGSSGLVTTLGVREAEDVAAAVEYVRQQIAPQPPILYGRSMGSVAILRAVAECGVRPAQVIVECPFNRLSTTVRNRFAMLGVPSFPSAELLVFWGGVQHGFWGFAHNPVEYAERVTCPVLILHGEDDARVSTGQAREVFDHLGGAKRFVLFEGVGHEPYLRANANLWNQAIAELLDE